MDKDARLGPFLNLLFWRNNRVEQCIEDGSNRIDQVILRKSERPKG